MASVSYQQPVVNDRSAEVYPPGKLNLFLELLGKRTDGYHELETVMMAIDRCDHLRLVRTAEPELRLSAYWAPSAAAWQQRLGLSDGPGLPEAEQNLVFRALEQFRERFAISTGFRVGLQKRIPAGAGMGGASSDAASALLAAAAVCEIDPAEGAIYEIAASLGSDVPFFLGSGQGVAAGVAMARGRGERIEATRSASDLHFVLVYPPEPLSTASVYGQCEVPAVGVLADGCLAALAGERSTSKGAAATGAAARGAATGGDVFFNRLTEPARRMSPWIDRTLEAIRRVGLGSVTMTGSGSACFGVARSARAAQRAARILASRRLGICFRAAPTQLPAPVRILT